MTPETRRNPAPDWRAAALLGLLTSTFSTVAVTLGAARIGRDITVDWIIVGTVLLRDGGLQAEPGWRELGAGVLVHLSADFFWAMVFFGLFWAMVFFGLLGRWTGRLSPWVLLLVAPPWALLSSAIEYYVTLPWLQPLFLMQQPYWTGLAVHLTASSLYPLYPDCATARFARDTSRRPTAAAPWEDDGMVRAEVADEPRYPDHGPEGVLDPIGWDF